MNLNRFCCAIILLELSLFKLSICAPTADTSVTKLEDKTADAGPTKSDSVSGPTKSDSTSGPTKSDSASSSSGQSKSDSASFSSSMEIKMDTSSSNSFHTLDTGGAEIIVASEQSNKPPENVRKVGSTVKLESTGDTVPTFSDSISLTGSVLAGTGTGEAVSVNSDPSGTKETFDTKADAFSAETIKTVESTSTTDVVKPETPGGVETLKVAKTSTAVETEVEVQAPEKLKTVEEKALESGTLGMPVDPNMFPVGDNSNIDSMSETPMEKQFLDTTFNADKPPPLAAKVEEPPILFLPRTEPPVLIKAPEPMIVPAAITGVKDPIRSTFLDTTIHASKKPDLPRLMPKPDVIINPKTPVSLENHSEVINEQNTNSNTNDQTGMTSASIDSSSTSNQNLAGQSVKVTETQVSETTVTKTAVTNTDNASILQNQLDKNTGSSTSEGQFPGDTFQNTPLNNFLTEGIKSQGREQSTGNSNSGAVGTSTGNEINWGRIIDPLPTTGNGISNSNPQLSEFNQFGNTVQEQPITTNFGNTGFNVQTTTVEPEFADKPEPCAMKPHPDRTKFFMGVIPMQCPGSLIWKQSKCYCDYPAPGDEPITLPSLQDGGCDFLLKLGMENTVDNEFPQFRVESQSRRRRISFENIPGSNGLSAHIKRSPLIVNAFQGNDLTGTMHINFRFRIANRRLNSRRLMILVSNGCGSSWKGPQPPSIALKFIPRNTTFKLMFRTEGKSVVEFLQPRVQPRDGWYSVALYLQDQWLTFEVNGETLYSSNGMSGSVVITPCPLKITGRTFEGYIDDFEFAKKCRYEPKGV